MQSAAPLVCPESSTGLQRRWASPVSRARTPIPSTEAVPISGFACLEQAPVNMLSQSITAKLVPHYGVGLFDSVCSRCHRAELSASAIPRSAGGDTHIRLHPYRRHPSSPQHVSCFTLGDEADRKDSAAIATAVRPSPRLSGVCNNKLSRRSFSSDLVHTSAQFRSVCTIRRLNSFIRNASCTDSSLMLECRTFPQPERVQILCRRTIAQDVETQQYTIWQSSWHVWMPKAAALTIP